ncbi:MAG TPA: amidohydrolase family protein [Acidimicrobiales bacterium]|nr:amidohydrolase family protein [Acidimicrobiales bacterium]
MSEVVVTAADLGGSELSRIRINRDRIVAVGPDVDLHHADEVIDAGGGAVIPGLHDHHVHLHATAAALQSLRLGPPEVADRSAFAAELARVDRELAPGAWIRAVGYHDSVAGPLDRHVLDALVPHRPVRVQDRSGSQWVLNSAGIDAIVPLATMPDEAGRGVERDAMGRPTGRLTRMDGWLARELAPARLSLQAVGAAAARAGVVGFTDATPLAETEQLDLLVAAQRAGDIRQRVTVMSAPARAIRPPATIELGPVKIVLDDDRLPGFEELCATVAAAHHERRNVAIHCVTGVQVVLTVAALTEAGSLAGDRIEHGAIIPDDLLAPLAALGVTVVTNPGFVAERGDDYLRDVDPGDVALLYRCQSLRRAGIKTAAGTDAPFGPADPWRVIRTCVERTTASGAALGLGEGVDPRVALSMFLGSASAPGRLRRIAPGQPADLCVLHTALDNALRAPAADNVALCLIGGAIVADNR